MLSGSTQRPGLIRFWDILVRVFQLIQILIQKLRVGTVLLKVIDDVIMIVIVVIKVIDGVIKVVFNSVVVTNVILKTMKFCFKNSKWSSSMRRM